MLASGTFGDMTFDFRIVGDVGVCDLDPDISDRTRFRREANAADNRAATTAVDSLINYEAVKVCTISLIISINIV